MTDSIRRKTLKAAGAFALLAGLAVSGPDGRVSASPISEHCQPSRPHAAGLTEHRIEVDGRTRTFMLHVPRSYTGETAVPLVFDLQASGISPAVELQVTGMDRAAEEDRLRRRAPPGGEGVSGRRNHLERSVRRRGRRRRGFRREGDRSGRRAPLHRCRSRLCGRFLRGRPLRLRTGLQAAEQIRRDQCGGWPAPSAASRRAPAGPGRRRSRSSRSTAPTTRSIPSNTSRERSTPYWTYGVAEAVSRWSGLMKCQPPAEEQLSETVRRLTWSDCRDGARIAFYRLSVSGHTWPGSMLRLPGRPGHDG
jgi:polyhydroxybutyrate depolymerase